MNKYTIYCTEDQTKKALELGAPILADTQEIKFAGLNGLQFDVDRVVIPTAEQMIGFLRSNGVKFLFSDEPDTDGCYWFIGNGRESISCGKENENKELAAIDAALEYLSNKDLIK